VPQDDARGGAPRRAPRYLALGDSYTIGEGVEPGERWPARLTGLLRGHGVPMEDPVIIARTGWTTEELAAVIERAVPRGPFALVTLLAGVNDQYRGGEVERYRERFAALLRRAITFAEGTPARVIVLSIPDWSVTPFALGRDRDAIAKAIDRFNQANREEAARAGARYVDLTALSREAARDRNLIAADGLHPSGRMHDSWAELALPVALEALGVARR
jgi:lysophospholipase L1-like esterase